MSLNFEFIAHVQVAPAQKKKKKEEKGKSRNSIDSRSLYIQCGNIETKEKPQQGGGPCNTWQFSH